MSEQTPPMGGLHQPPEKIESLLSMVRENLEMDVAFVSEFAGDQLLLPRVGRGCTILRWREGEGFPLDHADASGYSMGASPTWSPTPGAKVRRKTCG